MRISCSWPLHLLLAALLSLHVSSYEVHSILTARPANATGNLTFGAAITLNGTSETFLAWGPIIKNTLEMWCWWVNEIKGGIKVGDEVLYPVVKYINDWHSTDHVANITRHLVEQEGARFLFAPYSTTLTAAAAAVGEELGVVTMAGAASSTSIYAGKKYLYTPLTSSGEIMTSGIKTLVLRGAESIVTVTQDKTFTNSMCSPIDDYVAELAGATGLNASVAGAHALPADPSDADIEALMRNLTARPAPDLSVGCVYYDVCTRMIAAAKAHGYEPGAMLFSICVDNSNYLADVGADDGRYVLGAVNWHEDMQLAGALTGWSAKDFADTYRARYAVTPPYQSAAYFAGGLALVQAIEDAGSLDSDDVAYALSRLDVDTFFGTINFNSVNQNSNDYSYVQYDEAAELRVVLPDAVATGALVHPMPSWSHRQCVLDHGETSCRCAPGGCPECALDDYNYTVGACVAAGEYRPVTYARRQPGNESCAGGLALPAAHRVECDRVPLASATALVVQVVAYLGLAVALGFLAWVGRHRRLKLVKASQPEFLVLVCAFGAAFALSPLLLLGPRTVARCALWPWAFHLGFCGWVGALWVKTYRVWRIFGNTHMRRVKFTRGKTLKLWAYVMAIPTVLVGIWFLVDPPVPYTETAAVDYPWVVEVARTRCGWSPTWGTALAAYEAALAALAGYFGFRNRKVGKMFSETRYLVFAVYAMALLLGLSTLVAAQDVGLSLQVLLKSVGISLSSIVSLSTIFLPKIYFYWTVEDSDEALFGVSSNGTSGPTAVRGGMDLSATVGGRPGAVMPAGDGSPFPHRASSYAPGDPVPRRATVGAVAQRQGACPGAGGAGQAPTTGRAEQEEEIAALRALVARLNAKLPPEDQEEFTGGRREKPSLVRPNGSPNKPHKKEDIFSARAIEVLQQDDEEKDGFDTTKKDIPDERFGLEAL